MKAVFSGLAAAIMGAGLFAGGYALHDAPVRVEAHTVTVTKTAPAKVITKWETRTVTQTVTKTTDGMPCGIAANGLPYPPGSGTMDTEATCAATWQVSVPAALGGSLVLTSPGGQTNSWSLHLNG